MSQIFKVAAEKIKKSSLVIPVTLVFILMFITALSTSYEDYWTTLLGYVATPTLKANDWVKYFVALIPQTAMIGFTYMYLDNTQKKWAAILAFVCFSVDTGYDVYYKSDQFKDIGLIISALVESLTIYTLGSEIMLTSSVAMLSQLLPEFLDKIHGIYDKTFGVIKKFTKGGVTLEGLVTDLGLVDTDESKPQRGRPSKVNKPNDDDIFIKPNKQTFEEKQSRSNDKSLADIHSQKRKNQQEYQGHKPKHIDILKDFERKNNE